VVWVGREFDGLGWVDKNAPMSMSVAEHQLSKLEEERLDSEIIPTTLSPNSMDTYAVDEACIRTKYF